MFQIAEWSDDDGSGPQLCQSARPNSNDNANKLSSSQKKKKKKSFEVTTGLNGKNFLTSDFLKKLDRVTHSPSMSMNLIKSSPESAFSTPVTSGLKRQRDGSAEDKAGPPKRQKLSKSISSSISSLGEAVSDSASHVGSILKRGIRFASESEFVQTISNIGTISDKKKRKKKKKKGKNSITDQSLNSEIKVDQNDKSLNDVSPKKKKKKKRKKKKTGDEGTPNTTVTLTSPETEAKEKKRKKKKKEKNVKDNGSERKEEPKSTFPTSNKSQSPKFNVEKLKSLFKREESQSKSPKDLKQLATPDGAKNRLKASQFRFINEQLYSQHGSQSMKMFTQDKEAFKIYHQGYMDQVKKWPKDPLHIICNAIMKVSGNPIVADFGCGEARLARMVDSCCEKIYSFDLVAANELVTACDMAHTPLPSNHVDIAVFCLSLMGTNLRDFIREANRVLKTGGILKVAEVESRFQELDVDEFVKAVERCGFKLKWKDLSHKYFYLMDFEKVSDCKKKVPEFSLKACVYKKR